MVTTKKIYQFKPTLFFQEPIEKLEPIKRKGIINSKGDTFYKPLPAKININPSDISKCLLDPKSLQWTPTFLDALLEKFEKYGLVYTHIPQKIIEHFQNSSFGIIDLQISWAKRLAEKHNLKETASDLIPRCKANQPSPTFHRDLMSEKEGPKKALNTLLYFPLKNLSGGEFEIKEGSSVYRIENTSTDYTLVSFFDSVLHRGYPRKVINQKEESQHLFKAVRYHSGAK